MGGMVTLLRDHVALTSQAPFEALAAASHPALYAKQIPRPGLGGAAKKGKGP